MSYCNEKDTVVLSFDPCHLQHNVINARIWQPKGKEGTITIKTNTGRKRINILGALNLKDLSLTSMLTEMKCNAELIIEFLKRLKEEYPNMKIVVMLDNAKYNYARITREFAEANDIILEFLPAYSPNLNLIERLWKFTKKVLVHNTYHEKFNQFLEATIKFFSNLKGYESELKTLLTKKYELIHTD